MSTLEYLDDDGTVTNFTYVPWTVIHTWLSELNGNPHVTKGLAKGVNRGKVLEELEARRKGSEKSMVGGALRFVGRDRGYGRDWREQENPQGYTHLEELLIYQPKDWRKQAREYLFSFKCELGRTSQNEQGRTILKQVGLENLSIFLKNPILVVLFHPEIERTSRYEPLNFLLAYGACDPMPALKADMDDGQRCALQEEISPLDYFLEFQNYVVGYKLDGLRKIGKDNDCRRLCLIKELDYSDIIGQRLAKQRIRQAMVKHVWNRGPKGHQICSNRQPLSMIFAGPSGNGKTELALWLAKLMNKPSDDEYFIKVDCGKVSDDKELFGMSGPYQGASEGSALNNFVLRLSCEPDAMGIVLLDEIEKASQGVIHGLYQVIDKGEWTNKQLGRGMQTETIPCHNLVFIMTTNACDDDIQAYTTKHQEIYVLDGEDFEDLGDELEGRLRNVLRYSSPFTDAFIARVGIIVPFLPMATGDPEVQHPLVGESMTVAKLLIERQQDKHSSSTTAKVHQLISAKTKHRMARIIVKDSIPEAGVRSIQRLVEAKMGDRMVHTMLLEKGGIQEGSRVEYYAKEEDKKIDFRAKLGGVDQEESESDDDESDNEDAYA
jgi:DNA polymerase III delta prime subunit